ncbi:MBL fold metallo-hydrolase [Muriicola soli]|uniref:Pyrroloquinoline quinone biosynthesis protein PqqB n=1 Tax=Muriicola soli TaxID=2507538 RepID=A0A411ECG2_9FLAO|nr:MBL fold metallo-hydrolase [Muriicola soli]QBA65359.1 pyrroloquinoline quinone biosynthesis protein PqqB [Muriicola soli]
MKSWPQILIYGFGAALVLVLSCKERTKEDSGLADKIPPEVSDSGVSLLVLGTLQDAGSPQLGCKKLCCKGLFEHPDPGRKVVSLGIIDHLAEKQFLLEATPDITSQLSDLNQFAGAAPGKMPNGVFLTHAHIGHYTGLMYFGKEAVNASEVPVYAMPRMQSFLQNNGPWGQLLKQGNIKLNPLNADSLVKLTPSLSVTPLRVPHRDEYSETVGFRIKGPRKEALFIPDIDKWERWDRDISAMIAEVDYAFVDATFYHGEELNTRDISQIPHPFVIESMTRFNSLPLAERKKVYFIHLNHTNPLLSPESAEYKKVVSNGFRIAKFGEKIEL